MRDVKLTGEELDALTKERFGNMHSMYYDGFRRLMRDAIELNAKKDAAPTQGADGESLRPVAMAAETVKGLVKWVGICPRTFNGIEEVERLRAALATRDAAPK